MTYVYLNPEGLQSLIDGIKSYANLVYDEMLGVSNANIFYSSSNGVAPAELSGFVSRLGSRGADLKDQASYLQTRLDAARASNECGVSPMTMDGKISYYLPDDQSDTPEAVSAANHVDEWRQAKSDAQAFKDAYENHDQASMQSILDGSTAAHQNDPTYATVFTNTVGVDVMLDAPLQVQGDYLKSVDKTYDDATEYHRPEIIDTMESRFGAILSTASQEYAATDRQSGMNSGKKNLRDDIYNAVTEEGHEGRATTLDAYMTAPGTTYGTKFLVDLADKLEDLPAPTYEPSGFTKSYSGTIFDKGYGKYTDDLGSTYLADSNMNAYSVDPLSAVLGAMGNNSEAALAYLAPKDRDRDEEYNPNVGANDRAILLTSRHWTSESLEGASAAYAAASSQRVVDPESETGLEDARRAAWATAQGITLLGKNRDLMGRDSETTFNTGLLLGNSAPEMQSVQGTGTLYVDGSTTAGTPSGPNVPDMIVEYGGVNQNPTQLAGNIQTLLSAVAYDDDALSAIGQGATKYAALDAETEAWEITGPSETETTQQRQQKAVTQAFQRNEELLNWVTSTAEGERKHSTQAVKDGASAVASTISAIPGVGFVGDLASAGISASSFLNADEVKTANTETPESIAYAEVNAAAKVGALKGTSAEHQPWYVTNEGGTGAVVIDTPEKHNAFISWCQKPTNLENLNSDFITSVRKSGSANDESPSNDSD